MSGSGALDLSTGEEFQITKSRKRWPWIVGGVVIVVVIVLVVTLSVTLTGNNDEEDEPLTPTTDIPTTDGDVEPPDVSSEETIPPDEESSEETTPPNVESSEETTPPDVESSEETTPPDVESSEETTPPDVESSEETTPPDVESSEETTPPDVESSEETTPPDVESSEETTPPDVESSEETTPPDVESSEETTPPDVESSEETTTTETTTPVPDNVIDLDDIISGAFSAPAFNGTWYSGDEVLYRNTEGDLVLFNVDDGTSEVLVPYDHELLQQSERFIELSPDGSAIVLAYNVQQVHRHSFLAQYGSIDFLTGVVTNIVPPGATEALLQNFVWGTTGTSFAFVYMNNIFYQESLTSAPQQITEDGDLGVIYNGIPDWVYEEEIFSSHSTLWFSANGDNIAYASFDDTDVRIMHIPHFGVPGSLEYQYTQHNGIRYPKVGTTNPTVSVTIRNLQTAVTTTYHQPLSRFEDPVLKGVAFATNNVIGLMWANRVQNEFIVELCTLGSTECTTIFEYEEPNGWIDNIPLMFNQAGNAFITILPVFMSPDGVLRKQVVQATSTDEPDGLWTLAGRLINNFTVRKILHWTPEDVVWFQATSVTDSNQLHIFATSGVICFTCGIEREDGGICWYNEGFISTDASRVIVNCLGPGTPQMFIFTAGPPRTLVRMWEYNDKQTELVADLTMPQTIRLLVPVAEGLPPADVHIQVPDNYEELMNVPLLVNVYGGPDSGAVTLRWSIDWGTSLVSRWNIAVAHIDGRGSGLRGVDNLFAVNRRLGTVEVEDQITATRYIHDNLPWIDSNRTCIWGWSYGGYAASLALARGGSVFRCAAAVAPVTHWRYYDTLYTERYMGLPADNPQGYEDSSLITQEVVESFRDKRYFLIHGTEDDNVHYQHAMVFSRLLQTEDVYFKQMSYTDRNHALSDVLPHLYEALEDFLQENML